MVSAQQRKKILVVDDDPLICQILDKVLKARGYDVIIALDGFKALEEMDKNFKNVVLAIVDLVLPSGITGWDILEKWKGTKDTAHIPVVVITGVHISDKEIKRLSRNCEAIVRKQDFCVQTFGELMDDVLDV
ncbi:two-component system response regulator [Verrucomicrobiota bacterium]